MHVRAKSIAFGGLLLALSVVCMALGSVIETNTLFLLAAASYFVGIIIREFGMRTGAAFYLADVLLGFLVTSNKFYVISFAAMGFYILAVEAVWRLLERRPQMGKRHAVFWVSKYVIFNVMYLPLLWIFREMLFAQAIPDAALLGVAFTGQIALWIYDRAYEYVQGHIWNKMRGRLLR